MQDNDQTTNLDLTRRKILGSLGAAGAAGAAAGLGTSALFSDEEGFANNILEAGEFDLKVDWEVEYYNGLAPDPETISDSDTDDDGDLELVDDPGPIVDLQDVKPGDVIEHTLSLHLFGNPGFITMDGLITADSDAGFTEPEDQVDGALDDADGTPDGDLDDHLQCVAWYDGGTTSTDPGNNFPEEITSGYSPTNRDAFIDDLIDGNVSFDATADEFILQGTFANVMAALSGDLLLDPQVNGHVAGNFPNSLCFAPSTTQYIGVLCWLPRDIPGVDDNIVQSDSLEYELGFDAVQCRHNIANDGSPIDRPTGGVQPLTFEVTEGFGTGGSGPFDLQSDVGFPENMITSVDTSADPVEFVLDVPEPLDKSAGDRWSLVFDVDNDGTVDFRVVFDEFFYQEWGDEDGWGNEEPVPDDIDTGIIDGIYIVRIPRDRLSDPFAFAGRVCYGEAAPMGEDLCVSFTLDLDPTLELGESADDFVEVTLQEAPGPKPVRDFLFTSDRDSDPDEKNYNLFRFDNGVVTRLANSPEIDEHPERVGDRVFFARTIDEELEVPGDEVHREIFAMPVDGGNATQITDRKDTQFQSNSHPFAAPDENTLFITSKRKEEEGGGEVIREINLDGTPDGLDDGIVVDHGSASAGHSPTAMTDDGPKLFYYSDKEDSNELYRADLDGSNEEQLTNKPGLYVSGVAPSPDDRLAFTQQETPESCVTNIWVMDPDGSNQRQVTDGDEGTRWAFTWDDTDRIVYVTDANEDNTNEIKSIRYDGTDRQVHVSDPESNNQHLLRDRNCGGFDIPDLEMTAEPGTVLVDQPVTFEVKAAEDDDVDPFDEFDWRFGDNKLPVPETTTDNETTITHTYDQPGSGPFESSVVCTISACDQSTLVPGPVVEVIEETKEPPSDDVS